jgi:alcohol dehydrogenase
MPTALVHDPDLFETTPMDILAASAINGFDKGVEAIYSRFATPVTDATAVRGLRYLRSSLPHLRESSDPAVMERAVAGTLLVQYGVSMPDQYKINVVHAFGHALRNQYGIQQGAAHAVIVPHALELIFAEGGGRPDVLADGLVTGAEDADGTEAAVVEAVRTIRDGLGLPSRLRDIEGTDESELRAVAEHTAEDAFLDIGPQEFDPSVDEIEQTLRDAW